MRTRRRYVGRAARAALVTLWTLALGAGSREARAEDRTVTITGRFAYRDDAGNTVGIRFAPVEMRDDDTVSAALMGGSMTDANGFFSVTGTAGDWGWDGPDPFVKVIADAEGVKVRTRGDATYCFRTATTWDPANGSTTPVGTVSPNEGQSCSGPLGVSGEHGAWHLWNVVRQAWELMSGTAAPEVYSGSLATPGSLVPKVQVVWPNDCNGCEDYVVYANPDFLGVGANLTWNEAAVTWLYGGYHLLHHFAQYGHERWNLGVGGAFSELSTTFWQHQSYSSVYGCSEATGVPGLCGTLETPPHYHPDTGYDRGTWIASAILWDLQDDTPGEDHDGNDSADRLSGQLAAAWDVLVNYDPDPADPSHDHPTSLAELWDGVAARHPDLANRVSAIYAENHGPSMPAADLRVTALGGSPPAAVSPGGSFSLDDATANAGAVRTGEPSTTVFFLSVDATISAGDVPIGQRTVPNLVPSSSSTGTTVVTVPLQTPAGSYFVGACADAPRIVFESDEANNCAVHATQVLVQKANVLSITKAGTGGGTVASTPAGIDCGADCAELYPAGTVVTLLATPAAGSTFGGWSGGCAGTGACTLTVSQATTVTATFNLPPATLSVSTSSTLPGRYVTLTWSGIPTPSPSDWIGLYQALAPDTGMDDFVYVTPPNSTGGIQACWRTAGAAGVAGGSCRFRVPLDLSPGVYEFRLFPNDAFSPRLATSNPLTVQ